MNVMDMEGRLGGGGGGGAFSAGATYAAFSDLGLSGADGFFTDESQMAEAAYNANVDAAFTPLAVGDTYNGITVLPIDPSIGALAMTAAQSDVDSLLGLGGPDFPTTGVEALPGELGSVYNSFGDLFANPVGVDDLLAGQDQSIPWVTSTIITDPYEMDLLVGGEAIGSAMETLWQLGVHEICGSSPADAYWRSVEFGAIKGGVTGAVGGGATGIVLGEGVGVVPGTILGGIVGGVMGANAGIFFFGPLSAAGCSVAGVYK